MKCLQRQRAGGILRQQRREGDPKGWSTVLVTALGSWERTVPRCHSIMPAIIIIIIYSLVLFVIYLFTAYQFLIV
jgi:hypothetical protein